MLIAEAWSAIEHEYVGRNQVQTRQLAYSAISNMVDSLGDSGHTRFMTPSGTAQASNLTRGRVDGIGVEVQIRDNALVILRPVEGSPAHRAGLREGEVITSVDGTDVTNMPQDQSIGRVLGGRPGSRVRITVKDPGTGSLEAITLQRAPISIPGVGWHALGATRIAHLRVVRFSDGVSMQMAAAIRELQAQGMGAIILDLRNNPGGLLAEAVGIASQFLDNGNVLLEKDASGAIAAVEVDKGNPVTKLPMAVLVDSHTASASEIVAAALQDAGRAVLVGDRTVGTGTVMRQISLSDGSAILLATKEWLTPSGRAIWHTGIEPDVRVGARDESRILSPEMEDQMSETELMLSGDDQLCKAIEQLRR